MTDLITYRQTVGYAVALPATSTKPTRCTPKVGDDFDWITPKSLGKGTATMIKKTAGLEAAAEPPANFCRRSSRAKKSGTATAELHSWDAGGIIPVFRDS
jgi:hypothetical protein